MLACGGSSQPQIDTDDTDPMSTPTPPTSDTGAVFLSLSSGADPRLDGTLVPDEGDAVNAIVSPGLRAGDTDGSLLGEFALHAFATFDLYQADDGTDFGAVSGWVVDDARLRSTRHDVTGDPLADLGDLLVDRVTYAELAPMADIVVQGPACTTGAFPLDCDVTDAVRAALAVGSTTMSLRLRFDRDTDNDGTADHVAFSVSDPDTVQAGALVIDVSAHRAP
jgi:hypothetical protein